MKQIYSDYNTYATQLLGKNININLKISAAEGSIETLQIGGGPANEDHLDELLTGILECQQPLDNTRLCPSR